MRHQYLLTIFFLFFFLSCKEEGFNIETFLQEQQSIVTDASKRLAPQLSLVGTNNQTFFITGSNTSTTYKAATIFANNLQYLHSSISTDTPPLTAYHTATKVNDKVLIVGGENNLNIITYNNDNTAPKNTGSTINYERMAHTANLLNEQNILVVGGSPESSKLELINIVADNAITSRLLQELSINRQGHTTTIYQNNGQQKALIIGGQDINDSTILAQAEIHTILTEPSIGDIRNMPFSRIGHQAIYLANQQKVVITGGQTDGNIVMENVILFDIVTESFEEHPPLLAARTGHTMVALNNGKVLVIGGRNDTGSLASIEVYDPTNQTFTLLPETLQQARHGHATIARIRENADLLVDVLVYGGYKDEAKQVVVQEFELLTFTLRK